MMEEYFREPIPSGKLARLPNSLIRRMLTWAFPHLDPDYDPAGDLLEGKYREEMEDFYDLVLEAEQVNR